MLSHLKELNTWLEDDPDIWQWHIYISITVPHFKPCSLSGLGLGVAQNSFSKKKNLQTHTCFPFQSLYILTYSKNTDQQTLSGFSQVRSFSRPLFWHIYTYISSHCENVKPEKCLERYVNVQKDLPCIFPINPLYSPKSPCQSDNFVNISCPR